MYLKEVLLGWVVFFKIGLFWCMCVYLVYVVLVLMWLIVICFLEEDVKCVNVKVNEWF